MVLRRIGCKDFHICLRFMFETCVFFPDLGTTNILVLQAFAPVFIGFWRFFTPGRNV